MYNLDHKPRRPVINKPVTKAIDRQRRAEQRLKLFDSLYGAAMLGLLLIFIARLCTAILSSPWPVAEIGDRLAFKPGTPPESAFVVHARLMTTPWSAPGAQCTLDTAHLVAAGTSATVIATGPGGIMLSLAGQRAISPGDCRPGSDLLVSNSSYEQLEANQFPPKLINPK